jgi:hypothetical protein
MSMMSDTKQRNPGVRAGIKAATGYFNCNIFMGTKKDGTAVMSIGVNTPDGKTGFTDLHSKTSSNGKPYLSGVVTIGESKSLVKIDQIKTDDHNFLVLGISRIGGTPEKPEFTSLSAKGGSLYPNDLAKGSKLEAAFRETFTDLPADAFNYHPRESAADAPEQAGDAPAAAHAAPEAKAEGEEDAFAAQGMGF